MNVQEFIKRVKWLGHDGFRIEGEKTIYIDPFEISGRVSADIILVTHDHYDHLSPNDIRKIQHDHTIILTEKVSAKKLKGDVRIVTPGDQIEIGNMNIQIVPSYNINKKFHPQNKGNLGFIIEIDGIRIYHAGDTDLIPEMKTFKADIALLPVSGTYVMTADEAIEAAKIINPKIAIPMHYGSIIGEKNDAFHFKQKLEGIVDVVILSKTS